MSTALVMAGGQSSRMRKSFGVDHKSLVRVADHSLMDRNIAHLLHYGFEKIYIALNADETKLLEYVEDCVRPGISKRGAESECLIETEPLGTIGVAGQIPGKEPVVVVNVDNLSTIDLRAMLDYHVSRNADLTIAVHEEEFQIPFGQLTVDGDQRITEYTEKPIIPIPISSGTCVLGKAARESIPANSRVDINHLFDSLNVSRRLIVAYRHNDLWIDVNDAQAVQKANQLVEQNRNRFNFALNENTPPANPQK